jgi:hypothetical protein
MASQALAVECDAVAGHTHGSKIPEGITRTVSSKGNSLVLGPLRGEGAVTLTCERLPNGLMCGRRLPNGTLAVMTNGSRMVETVKDQAGKEIMGIAYVCDAPLHTR